jgi:hypothetical protein
MATTTSRMGSFYNEKLAGSQLRKYREKGPIALRVSAAKPVAIRPRRLPARTCPL